MTDAGHIRVEREGPVARITINRPPLNILNISAMQELGAALESLRGPPHLRFVVFTGSKRAFSAGADVLDHTPERVVEMLDAFHGVFRKLWKSDWVTIAAVQGHCLGGGMELATVCDFVLATHTARFGQPEIKLGCFPPVAVVLLPALVGPRRALDLILTGRDLPAAEAHQLGLVNRIVGEDELDQAVQELLDSMLPLSPVVVPLTRRAVLRASGLDFERTLEETEKVYLDTLMQTADAVEGIRAFIERRRPVWTGR